MKNQLIVIINGDAGVGKDTFVSLSQYANDKIAIKNISTVDKVKEAAMLLGWNGDKDEQSRFALHELKKISVNYFNGVMQYIKFKINEFYNLYPIKKHVVFIHCREPEEIQKIKNVYLNAITLLIKSNRVKRTTSNEADVNVYNYKYDYILENNETEVELMKKAEWFIGEIFG